MVVNVAICILCLYKPLHILFMKSMSRRSRCTTLFPVLSTVSPMSGKPTKQLLVTCARGKISSNSPEYAKYDHQYEGDCNSRGETDQDNHHCISEKEHIKNEPKLPIKC